MRIFKDKDDYKKIVGDSLINKKLQQINHITIGESK